MATTATPNYSKQLLDALKTKKLKTKKLDAPNGKTSRIANDERTLARIVPGKNGALRVYVFADKLPAKLAKSFTTTKGMGYSLNVKSDAELKSVVEAIVHTASEESA